MRKIAFLVFIALAVSLTANAADWQSAGPFTTAQLAADFANSLSARSRSFAQFVCESGNDLPASSTYRVFYRSFDAQTDDSGFRWEVAVDLANIETAIALANEKLAWPRLAVCWNAQKNPERALTTLFYIANAFSENYPHRWQLADRSFPTAEEAADYANRNLAPNEIWTARFVPEFSAATQTANSWRVVFIGSPGALPQPVRWRVAAQDDQGYPLGAESALAVVNSRPNYPNFSTAVTMTRIQSQIVLFLLEPETQPQTGEPQAKLEIPTTVYASRRFISKKTSFGAAQGENREKELTRCCAELVTEIQNSAKNSLLQATRIAVFVDNSPQAKTEIKARLSFCFATKGPNVAYCEILITEKLFRNFDNDELFGVLAHEAKHASQRVSGEYPDSSVEREHVADIFAVALLAIRGRRKTAIITGLNKVLKEGGFTTAERLEQIKLRITRMEKLLGIPKIYRRRDKFRGGTNYRR